MTVTDNERVRIHVCCQYGMEFRLRTRFKSEVVFLTMRNNFLNDRTHLIHLNREDDKVVALEIIFFTCLYKAFVGLLDTVIKNVREAKENGRLNMARCQFVNHFLKIYLYTILTGRNVHVTLIVDAKIVYAPSFDVVELFRIFNSPFTHND